MKPRNRTYIARVFLDGTVGVDAFLTPLILNSNLCGTMQWHLMEICRGNLIQ